MVASVFCKDFVGMRILILILKDPFMAVGYLFLKYNFILVCGMYFFD